MMTVFIFLFVVSIVTIVTIFVVVVIVIGIAASTNKVAKISKNQSQPTNEASFWVVLDILVCFKHMVQGIE